METIFGLAGLFFLMALQVVIPPIPAELIVISSGKFYGIKISTFVAGSGLFVGSIAVYWMGYYIHQRFGRFFNQQKIRKILEGFQSCDRRILWVRILPYNPSDLIAYAAGIAKIDWKTFASIALVTSYVRCGLLSWLGKYIFNFKELFVVLSILLLSAFLSYALLFKKN